MTLSEIEGKPTLLPADEVMSDITNRSTSPVDGTSDTTKCEVRNYHTVIQGPNLILFGFIFSRDNNEVSSIGPQTFLLNY